MDNTSLTDKLLSELNPEQKQAVTHDKGPLLIIAGAGTGKTMVISRRIANLVVSKLAKPEEILALTFTDKAADEMEERVDVLVPYGFINAEISTFHAFGDKILRDHAIDIGLTSDYRVMTRPDQIIFFREHLNEFPLNYYKPLSDPTRHISTIVTYFSRLRDEDVLPEEYLAYAEKLPKTSEIEKEDAEKHLELARVYKTYQDLKMKKGVIDFGDQVTLALNLLRKRPGVLKRLQEKFKYILVDEFQDTNYAQFELVKLVVSGHDNITVVGDDDQSIYKFRGAAISNILGFSSAYPNAKKVVLTKNYRSSQEILDTSYRLVRFNDPERLEIKEGVDKKLVSEVGSKTEMPVTHLHFDAVTTEADDIAKRIASMVEEKQYSFKDIAILVRANADARPFINALNFKGIPYHFSGSRGLYAREEVRMAVGFLRVIANFEDSISLFYLSRSDIYRMDEMDLQKINTYAINRNKNLHYLFEHIKEIPELEDITDETKATIEKIASDIKKYTRMAQEKPTGQVLYQFLKDTGYISRLARIESLEIEEKAKNLSNFFYKVKEFESIAEHDRVNQFVAHLDMLISAGDDPATAEADFDADAVNILTVHKAKGLEFPVVFMVSLVSDKFPSRKRKEFIEVPEELIKEQVPAGDFHVQEERRLFYVAMTRAKKELYLTSARDYGGRREKKLSQFVLEALDLPKADAKAFKASAMESIELFAPPQKDKVLSERVIPEDELLTLSYNKVNDYLDCPLKYKYAHIIRLPVGEKYQLTFGNALHKAAQLYHQRKANKKDVKIDDLFVIYEKNWSSFGFISREHEDQYFIKGKEILKGFFKREEESGIIPAYVEEKFGFTKDRNRIIGRWDRIDIVDDKIIIIDYKSTLDVKNKKDADKKAKGSKQLQIYALAYQEMKGKLPDHVELRFLETGMIGEAYPKQSDFDKILDTIDEAAKGIRKADFSPKPDLFTCKYCSYSSDCDYSRFTG